MRGKPGEQLGDTLTVRITPAHAGKTNSIDLRMLFR